MPTDEPLQCCHAAPEPTGTPPRSRWGRRAYAALALLLPALLSGIGEEAGHHLVSGTVSTVVSITE
ncbi:hypothetical protein ACIRL2_41380 [Embleya sp. NPDC127516]|uniref:hypothetical protein n=1 Tax=Embleya sp. NPDC127516 TaxID=3363990 RepID=UPI0037F6DAFC